MPRPSILGGGGGGIITCARLSVCPTICRVPQPTFTTERPKKPKMGMVEDQHTSNPCTYLEVKRSKVKVTSPGDLIKAGVTGYCKEMYIASAKEQKCDAPNKENYATAITNYIGL